MIVANFIEIALVLMLRIALALENRRRDRVQAEQGRRDLDETAFSDLTDKENLNFRYIY